MQNHILALYTAFIVLTPTATYSLDVEIGECKPRNDATFSLVYLHGLDPKAPSTQELQNRAMLEKLSIKHRANLIMPRSNIFCKQEKRCWLHEDTTEHAKLYKAIVDTAKTCVPKPLPMVLLGFSNGGYFSSKAAMLCYEGVSAVIASGSAGQIKDAVPATKQPRACPILYLTIGEQDLTFKKAQSYYHALKELGYPVELKTFKGRHELSMKTLDSVLDEISTNLNKKKGS